MKKEKALDIMEKCVTLSLTGKLTELSKKRLEGFKPLDDLDSIEDVLTAVRYVADLYADEVKDGCREGSEYLICIDRCAEMHPINVFATIFVLLMAEAEIHVIFDGSYDDGYENPTDIITLRFLDVFLRIYEKAVRVEVEESMTYKTKQVIEDYCKKNKGIADIVFMGDFINFGSYTDLVNSLDIRFYLPAAHYVILDYSSSTLSYPEEKKLESFGKKCWYGKIDYAAYETEGNCFSNEGFGFDVDSLFSTYLTQFFTLRNMKGLTGKVTTVIFTDKEEKELVLPSGFSDCCEVFLSERYDCEILNYDFSIIVG